MKSAPQPDAACRWRYLLLQRQTRRGLAAEEIERSRSQWCRRVGSHILLKKRAYLPTGLALGCPLPDRRLERRLRRIADLAEGLVAGLCPGKEWIFAHVPCSFYHVTLLNRSHFEISSASVPLGRQERDLVQRLVTEGGEGAVTLHFQGLILTAGGRLIVPGFPADDRFYAMRSALAEAMPGLRTNIPNTAHIKLGHLLTAVEGQGLEKLLGALCLCGQRISARVAFEDAYTPAGRIWL